MTANYSVTFKPSAAKELRKINKNDQTRIAKKIQELASNPYPPGTKKIVGGDGELRLRVGNYRVIYAVEEGRLIILVLTIGHRREVYKN
ncbi:type II toxin-antitoxin system RelE family toxin [Rothia nasimurium]|uniref:type II toxin-antitoxin system RelE family toxin n=1 Tax=Rothia nasimurium TaxID=85336 RepID=UPI001F3784A5|nr:type II toxin-antitoxin system RelE/ParE family toxin [Rothia nasimurium]